MSFFSPSRSIYPASILPASSSLDLGSTAAPWRSVYVGTSILGTGGAGFLTIRPDTADASDNSAVRINGGGAVGSNGSRGANILCYGNESVGTGGLLLDAGGVTGATVEIRTFQAGGSINFATAVNVAAWSIINTGQLRNQLAANEATGAGSALLGANCPATTASAPYTWLKIRSSDNSNVYIPVWK
jgi:hypothetical protein